MAELINEIKYHLSRLESLYESYKDYKYKSKYDKRKKDRERATDSMFVYANMLEQTLVNPPIAEIIVDGGQYQFEDFWKYVDSDMPDYLAKIKQRIIDLENPVIDEDNSTKIELEDV